MLLLLLLLLLLPLLLQDCTTARLRQWIWACEHVYSKEKGLLVKPSFLPVRPLFPCFLETAHVIDLVAALERKGGALPPRPVNMDGPSGVRAMIQGKFRAKELGNVNLATGGTKPGHRALTEEENKDSEEAMPWDQRRRRLNPPFGPRAYDCCTCA